MIMWRNYLVIFKVLLLTLLNALKNGAVSTIQENCSQMNQDEIISKLCSDAS